MAKIVIIRLTALTDVAMTLPVLYSAAKANPQDQFTLLTQTFMMPVFSHRPNNLEVIGISLKGAERSLWGLLRFAFTLLRFHFDMVLDLQDSFRSKVLRLPYQLLHKPVYIIDKIPNRFHALLRKEDKCMDPLPTLFERFADVIRKAGLQYVDSFTSLFDSSKVDQSKIINFAQKKQGQWIGVSPFARYEGKIYPIDEMEQVVATLSKQEGVTVFLFGARGYEEAVLEEWAYRYPHVECAVGKYSLDKELALISQLDLLLSMDSANMHFASLVGTRVLSIWGATHPALGYYGYHQQPEDCIQLPLPCRPCAKFGNKNCMRGDWACLKQLTPEIIINRVLQALSEKKHD